MMRWHAVYTQARLELWARANLWERGFEVYIPRYLKNRRHARKMDRVAAPLFPRYLFVRADLAAGGQRAIDSAPGAVGLVRFGATPSVVCDQVISEIQAREGEDGFIQLSREAVYAAGEAVRIETGSLCDQVGIFQCATDDARVVILLNLMGRRVPVTLSVDDVTRDG